MSDLYDYAVIGSGPGGAVVAHHLNAAGAKVVVLEAGKYFRRDTFPRNEADASAQLYWGGGIEFDSQARLGFLRARAVGGTTIINQALVDRFDELAWADWRAQSGIDFFSSDAMQRYYEAVEDFIAVYQFNRQEFNRNACLYTEACERLDYGWGLLRRAQSDCAGERGNDCIGCLSGCHRDSKQSSMVTYIRSGEQAGLELISETEVDHIEDGRDQVTIYATSSGTRVKYLAKKVIVAGGCFGTTKILLKSGLQRKLPALGKYFSSHPQFMNFGVFDEPVNAHRGYFQTVASKDPNFRAAGFKLEIVFAGPVSIAMLFNEFGRDHYEIMRNYTRINCVEVAVRDENVGQIRLNHQGRLEVEKPLTDQDLTRRDAGMEVVHRIMTEAGAKRVMHAPLNFCLHLMGGAVMGTDARTSVVGPDFKLHNSDNIYVCDSSLFPNAPGINPSLTVFALSQKLSEQLVGRVCANSTSSSCAAVPREVVPR